MLLCYATEGFVDTYLPAPHPKIFSRVEGVDRVTIHGDNEVLYSRYFLPGYQFRQLLLLAKFLSHEFIPCI